jgi:hypothetical protein
MELLESQTLKHYFAGKPLHDEPEFQKLVKPAERPAP